MQLEIRQSAERLAEITSRTPRTLAYPYGDRCAADSREYRTAQDLGFKLAVTTNPGTLQNSSLENLFSLPRISLNGYYQKCRYVGALASGIPFALAGSAQG